MSIDREAGSNKGCRGQPSGLGVCLGGGQRSPWRLGIGRTKGEEGEGRLLRQDRSGGLTR